MNNQHPSPLPRRCAPFGSEGKGGEEPTGSSEVRRESAHFLNDFPINQEIKDILWRAHTSVAEQCQSIDDFVTSAYICCLEFDPGYVRLLKMAEEKAKTLNRDMARRLNELAKAVESAATAQDDISTPSKDQA